MNERIKQLATRTVGDYSNNDYWPFFTEELEKFAELIVRECVVVLDEKDGSEHHSCLLEHFGVEE